eukprot:GGOE01036541.1.p1 GENE.GGOE01036541.1~~GGOE01036541.1.p1  ORF type:complete len:176 (-),score=38.47 GGOE01036541.1:249-776(-)
MGTGQAVRSPKQRIALITAVILVFLFLLKVFTASGPLLPADEEFPGIIVRVHDQLPAESINADKAAVRKRVILGNREVPHLVGYTEVVLAPNSEIEWHIAPGMYEVFTGLQGTGVIAVAKEPEVDPARSTDAAVRNVEVGPSVTVAVRPFFYHAIRNTGESDLVLLCLGISEKNH